MPRTILQHPTCNFATLGSTANERAFMRSILIILWSAALVFVLATKASAQGGFQPEILTPGTTFAFDRAFSGRIVKADFEPYLVADGREISATGDLQFLVVTIELTNNGTVPMAPFLGWRTLYLLPGGDNSSWDWREVKKFNNWGAIIRMLNRDTKPITPGGTGRLLDVYQVPSSVDRSSLYYQVKLSPETILAALPR
jgi:hypothetical protein